MDLSGIINFMLIIGAIQGFAFNIFTIHITRRRVSRAVVYLNLTVLFLSLNNLQAWFFESFQVNNFFIKDFLIPWDLGIVPVFHAFLVYYLRIERSHRTFIKLATNFFLILIILRTLLLVFVYYLVPEKDNFLISNFTIFEEIFIAGFSLFLFYKCYLLLFKKQHLYSFILKFDDISWLKTIWKIGGAMFLLWVIAITLFNTTGDIQGYHFLRLGLSGLIYWIGYQGFFRYNNVNDRIFIRRSISSEKALKINEKDSGKKQPKSPEANSKQQEEFENIHNRIIEEQFYLDPNLGLDELAKELDLSSTYLSRLINTYSNYNFSDYINSLRIQQAKKLLNDDSFCRYTIVSIGLECGFNSKSTFYAAFKKFTSVTPTEFRDTTC